MRVFKLCIPFLLFAFLYSPFASAQNNDKEYKHVITSYPLSFFISTIKLGYELRASEILGVKVIGSLASAETSYFYGIDDFTEFGFELHPRFYILGQQSSMSGFYMAPFGAYRSASFKVTEIEYNPDRTEVVMQKDASTVTAGYVFGFQKIFPSRLAFDVYAGGGISTPSGDFGYIDVGVGPYRKGISPHFGAAIGFGL